MSAAVPKAVPLDRLHPAGWNPRTINDARFQNLVRSVEADPEFLWRRPVLATADGTIYAGNMRFRAAQHLGLEAVPAIVEDIPQQLAKERALRDNHQWGEWQEDLLGEMVSGLAEMGSPLELLGFTEDALAALLGATEATGAGGGKVEQEMEYAEAYAVAVVCRDAAEQERVYDELRTRGYECRLVVV